MTNELSELGPDPFALQKKDSGFFSSNELSELGPDPFAPPEEPSSFTEFGKELGKGTIYGIPHMLSKATQALGIGGKDVSKWAEEGLGEEPKTMLGKTGRLIPEVVGLPLATAAIAALTPGLAPAAAFAATANYAVPALFGLQQYQETKERAEAKGVEPGAAPFATGAVSSIGMMAANMALSRLLGPLATIGTKTAAQSTIPEVLKGTIGSYVKEMAVHTMPTAVLTGAGMAWANANIEKYAGIRPEAQPGAEAVQAAIPMALMTAILGPAGRVAHNYIANKSGEILSQKIPEDVPDFGERANARLKVAQGIQDLIPKDNKNLRQQWNDYVTERVKNNQPIDLTKPLDELSLGIENQMNADLLKGENASVSNVTGTPVPGVIEKPVVEEVPAEKIGKPAANNVQKEIARINDDRIDEPEYKLPDDIEIVKSGKREKELKQRYGIPNATGFGKDSGKIYIDDDTGKPVAYVPSKKALAADGTPFVEREFTPEEIKSAKEFKEKYTVPTQSIEKTAPVSEQPLRAKHFTSAEGKAALERGEKFDYTKKPIHGTGGLSQTGAERVGRFAGDRLYLSLDDKIWGRTSSREGEDKIVEVGGLEHLKELTATGAETFFDYDKQKWMAKVGAKIVSRNLESVEYEIDAGAKIKVIDSVEKFEKAQKEVGQQALHNEESFFKALEKNYDAVVFKNVDKMAHESDLKFFRAIQADQIIVLNTDKARIVKPVQAKGKPADQSAEGSPAAPVKTRFDFRPMLEIMDNANLAAFVKQHPDITIAQEILAKRVAAKGSPIEPVVSSLAREQAKKDTLEALTSEQLGFKSEKVKPFVKDYFNRLPNATADQAIAAYIKGKEKRKSGIKLTPAEVENAQAEISGAEAKNNFNLINPETEQSRKLSEQPVIPNKELFEKSVVENAEPVSQGQVKEKNATAKLAKTPQKGKQNMVTLLESWGGINWGKDFNAKEMRQSADGKRVSRKDGIPPDIAIERLKEYGIELKDDSELAELIQSGEGRQRYAGEKAEELINRKIEKQTQVWAEEQARLAEEKTSLPFTDQFSTKSSPNAPETERPVTMGLVKSIFQDAKISQGQEGDNFMIVTLPNNKKIIFATAAKITPDSIAFRAGRSGELKEGDKITGKWQQLTENLGKVTLEKDNAGNWTFAHESAHAVRDLVLTRTDISLLDNYVRNLVKDGKLKANDENNPGNFEDFADFMADVWTGNTAKYQPNTIIKRIVGQLKDFMDKVMNAFGIRTAGGVIRDIESGQIFRGKGFNQISEDAPALPAYSLSNNVKSIIGTVKAAYIHPEKMPKSEVEAQTNYWKSFGEKEFSKIDYALSVPFRNAQKYPEWKEAWRVHGIERAENRSLQRKQFIEWAEPFFNLNQILSQKGYSKQQQADSLSRIERTLVAQDIVLHDKLLVLKGMEQTPEIRQQISDIYKNKRFTDQELLSGIKDEYGDTIKLNQDEVDIFKSVPEALEKVKDTMINWMKTQTLHTYRNHKWYNLLVAATGVDLNSDTFSVLLHEKGLNNAALQYAKKISPNMSAIFDRIENDIAGVPIEEIQKAGNLYTKVANNMQADLTLLQGYLKDLTHIEDPAKLTELTKDIFSAYLQTRPQLKRIKEMRNDMDEWAGFLPRSRESGKSWVRLVEKHLDTDGNMELDDNLMPMKDTHYFSQMVNNKSQDTKAVEELMRVAKKKGLLDKDGNLQEGFQIERSQAVKTPEASFYGVKDTDMAKIFDNAMQTAKAKGVKGLETTYTDVHGKERSVFDDIQNAGYEAIANQFKARGAMRAGIHREEGNIKGYTETGLQEVIANYMNSMSGLMTKQKAAMDMMDLLGGIKNQSMFESISKYNREMLRNESGADRASGVMRSMMFTTMLGGLLKSAVINLTQNPIVGFAELAKYQREHGLGGFGKADLMYANAMKDVLMNNLSMEETVFIKHMVESGLATDQYIRSIMDNISGDAFLSKHLAVTNFLAKPFSMSEIYNRKSAAIAMYRTAYDKYLSDAKSSGLGETEAKAQAYKQTFDDTRTYIDNVHYAMGKANRPLWMMTGDASGATMAAMYTFRGFNHNFLERQRELLSQKDFKTFAHTMAWMAMFGGMASIPFVKDSLEWIEKQLGYSPNNYIRTALRGIGGETLEKFGMTGLPSVLGANFSGSLAIGLPWPIGSPSPEDSMFGVWSGFGQKMVRGYQAIGRGDLGRAVTEIAPEFIRNPRVALRESAAGKELLNEPGYASTPSGRPMLNEKGKPIQLSTYEAGLKTFGFNPTNYAREKELNRTILRQETWANERKKDVAETYRVARINNEPNALRKMVQGVAEVNAAIRSRGIERLVPLMSVSKVIQQSREQYGIKQRRETAYKQRLID